MQKNFLCSSPVIITERVGSSFTLFMYAGLLILVKTYLVNDETAQLCKRNINSFSKLKIVETTKMLSEPSWYHFVQIAKLLQNMNMVFTVVAAKACNLILPSIRAVDNYLTLRRHPEEENFHYISTPAWLTFSCNLTCDNLLWQYHSNPAKI